MANTMKVESTIKFFKNIFGSNIYRSFNYFPQNCFKGQGQIAEWRLYIPTKMIERHTALATVLIYCQN